jgi:hypothetical protein
MMTGSTEEKKRFYRNKQFHHLILKAFWEMVATPTISKCDRNSTFGITLPDDVRVKLDHNLKFDSVRGRVQFQNMKRC